MKGFHVMFVWGFCGSYLSEEELSGTGKLDTRLMFTPLKQLIVCDAAFLTQDTSTFGDNDRLRPFSLALLSSHYFVVSSLSSFSQITSLHECVKEGLSPKLWTNCVFFHVQSIWSHKYIWIENVFVTRVKHSLYQDETSTAGAQKMSNNHILDIQKGV